MPMPIILTQEQISEIQNKYSYLINYESDNPESPIDPLSYSDSNGDHLLHIAAHRGDLRTVELLVSAGVNVDQIGDMNYTALHYAKQKCHDDVVKFLLSSGASTKILNDFGRSPDED